MLFCVAQFVLAIHFSIGLRVSLPLSTARAKSSFISSCVLRLQACSLSYCEYIELVPDLDICCDQFTICPSSVVARLKSGRHHRRRTWWASCTRWPKARRKCIPAASHRWRSSLGWESRWGIKSRGYKPRWPSISSYRWWWSSR